MATGFASALSEGQPAQLDLGEEAVPCLVVGFTGADVVLAPKHRRSRPRTPSRPGLTTYLLIDAGGTLQALKAEVRRGRHRGRARRHAARPVPPRPAPHLLARPARPARAPAPGRRPGRAEDHLHARHQRRRPARRAPVVLPRGRPARRRDRARAGQPRDQATAETVRVTDTDVSLSFIEIEPEDRLILAQLTFAYHRRRAGQ